LAIGSNALYNNNGGYNIALGFDAGYNVTTGSNNIEIGASGTASDDGTIQIGVQGTQTSTTIAGIFGTTVTGSAVYVTATGQGRVEGVRYEELAPMLLNEVQKQQAAIRSLTEKQNAYARNYDAQAAEIRDLRKLIVEMQAGLIEHRAKGELVAQR
jgi:hypothetical protein